MILRIPSFEAVLNRDFEMYAKNCFEGAFSLTASGGLERDLRFAASRSSAPFILVR